METKRVFIGVDISDQARARVAGYIETLKNEFAGFRVAWVKPDNLHLTIKFIGPFESSRLQDLNAVIGGVAVRYSTFSVSITGTGAFTKRRSQAVLGLGVAIGAKNAGEDELGKIGRMLNEGCAKLRVELSNRPLMPHLTVARVKEHEKARDLIDRHLAAAFAPLTFEVSGI